MLHQLSPNQLPSGWRRQLEFGVLILRVEFSAPEALLLGGCTVHLAHVFGRNTRSTRISDIFHCLKIVLLDSRIHLNRREKGSIKDRTYDDMPLIYSQNLRWSSHIRAMNEFKQSHSNVQEKAPLKFEQFY